MFLPNIRSFEEYVEIAQLLYKTCKAITQMNYIHKESADVIHRNSRIGIGVTGICQAINKTEWCDNAYRELREYDVNWSSIRNWPASIKLATIKPSGTLSLLAGVTPGVHPAYAQYYVRRVRMSSDDTLIDYCRTKGYTVEFARGFDGSPDYSTSIVSFPCTSGENAILASNMSAIEQLELVKQMQTVWSDSAVSVTVYYKKEDLPVIKEWLAENYEHSIKAVSFLLHSDHGFEQAPYTEISEDEYYAMVHSINPFVDTIGGGSMLDEECATGVCPTR